MQLIQRTRHPLYLENNGVNQELEASRCQEPLELTPEARKAFADRQGKLIADARWPLTGWYNDKDFCRAYNTATTLYDENRRLRLLLLEVSHRIGHYISDSPDDPLRCSADCLACRLAEEGKLVQ